MPGRIVEVNSSFSAYKNGKIWKKRSNLVKLQGFPKKEAQFSCLDDDNEMKSFENFDFEKRASFYETLCFSARLSIISSVTTFI